jgi:hypothetical protein
MLSPPFPDMPDAEVRHSFRCTLDPADFFAVATAGPQEPHRSSGCFGSDISRKEGPHARHDTHHHPDPDAPRRAAQLGYSRSWGYGPSGGFGLILIILIILVLLGRV